MHAPPGASHWAGQAPTPGKAAPPAFGLRTRAACLHAAVHREQGSIAGKSMLESLVPFPKAFPKLFFLLFFRFQNLFTKTKQAVPQRFRRSDEAKLRSQLVNVLTFSVAAWLSAVTNVSVLKGAYIRCRDQQWIYQLRNESVQVRRTAEWTRL
jgi:hypothetical protein